MSDVNRCNHCVASGQLLTKEPCIGCFPIVCHFNTTETKAASANDLDREWKVQKIIKSKKLRGRPMLYLVKFQPTYEKDPYNSPWYDRLRQKGFEDELGGSICYWMDEWLPKENIHPYIVKEFHDNTIKKRRKRRKYR